MQSALPRFPTHIDGLQLLAYGREPHDITEEEGDAFIQLRLHFPTGSELRRNLAPVATRLNVYQMRVNLTTPLHPKSYAHLGF